MSDSKAQDDVKPSSLMQDASLPHSRRLQFTREAKQWSLDSVAMQLKIRPSQVIAMEEGDWHNICPDPSFAQSYLRNYIQLLDLPVEKTLREYGEVNERPISLHSVNTVGAKLNVQPKHLHLPSFWRWAIVAAVLLVIGWQVFAQWDIIGAFTPTETTETSIMNLPTPEPSAVTGGERHE